MLIKYYGYDYANPEIPAPTAPDLFIIENIENVVVHGGVFGTDDHGPDINTVQIHRFYDRDSEIQAARPSKKLITFTKDGSVNRLQVYGTAYVCNNDGETIEKVSLS